MTTVTKTLERDEKIEGFSVSVSIEDDYSYITQPNEDGNDDIIGMGLDDLKRFRNTVDEAIAEYEGRLGK